MKVRANHAGIVRGALHGTSPLVLDTLSVIVDKTAKGETVRDGTAPRFRLFAAIVALSVLAAGTPAARAAQSKAAPGPLATVRFIYHGLAEKPPLEVQRAGKVRDPLFNAYLLRTRQAEKASISFADGTVLQINQNTDTVLASPHQIRLRSGEIAEYLAPGTDHRVQTATAAASAIGTTYDVRVTGPTSIFVVLHGALQVTNGKGQVLVKSNRETLVRQGAAPTPPSPVDARAVFAWTDGIPTPDLGEDVSLDANGGVIKSFSSQREGGGSAGKVEHIHDGLLSQGWESAAGQVSNQFVKVGFLGGNLYRVAAVIIDPAATYGDPPSEDLKDFEIRVSTTDTADASFTTVFRGRCRQSASLQKFSFPAPQRAKYVELVALSNYASPVRVAVAEWEVVATASLFAQPTGVAVDSHGNVYVADTNANRIDKLSPKGQVLGHWGKKGEGPGEFTRPEGVAVDRAGNIYVADTFNDRVEKLSPKGKFLASWGSPGISPGQLFFPTGIAVDAAGNVYVADFYNRVQKFSPSGHVLGVFDTVGAVADCSVSPLSCFDHPEGLTLGADGSLCISDTDNARIVKMSSNGVALATFGTAGKGLGQFDQPIGIAVDRHGAIYVADSFNARIEKIDPAHGTVRTWGSAGTKRGAFLLPTGVAVSSSGTVFVADKGNSRIQRFSTAGKLKSTWGKYATVANVLGEPEGVAVDSKGVVYVSDALNDRIQQRAPSGRLLAVLGYHGYAALEKVKALGQFWFPHGIAIDRQGAIYVADTFNNRIQILAPRGPIGQIGAYAKGAHALKSPWGVAVDSAGTVYVADTFSERIVVFSKKGKWLRAFGTQGSAPGQFFLPSGIAVDSHGNIYVADSGNNRVEKFTSNGTLVWTLGGKNGPLGRFALPRGIAVDGQDNVYVADNAHGAVQKLSPDGTLLQEFLLPGPEANVANVAVGRDGKVYATDQIQTHVVVFAPTGEVTGVWE